MLLPPREVEEQGVEEGVGCLMAPWLRHEGGGSRGGWEVGPRPSVPRASVKAGAESRRVQQVEGDRPGTVQWVVSPYRYRPETEEGGRFHSDHEHQC